MAIQPPVPLYFLVCCQGRIFLLAAKKISTLTKESYPKWNPAKTGEIWSCVSKERDRGCPRTPKTVTWLPDRTQINPVVKTIAETSSGLLGFPRTSHTGMFAAQHAALHWDFSKTTCFVASNRFLFFWVAGEARLGIMTILIVLSYNIIGTG